MRRVYIILHLALLLALKIDANAQLRNPNPLTSKDSSILSKHSKSLKKMEFIRRESFVYYDTLMLKELFHYEILDKTNDVVQLELLGSKVIIEEDIILGDTSRLNLLNGLYREKPKQLNRPSDQTPINNMFSIRVDPGFLTGAGRWTGDVHFKFGEGFSTLERNKIISALNVLIEKTNVQFKLASSGFNGSYIKFTKNQKNGGNCSGHSFVGRDVFGKEQEIILSYDESCSRGLIIHEVCHALGLFHEQSRSDRNDFVEILRENIQSGKKSNFQRHNIIGTDFGDYDFGSIMHYSNRRFGIKDSNGEPKETIRVKPSHSFRSEDLGQRDSLTKGDIASINNLFPVEESNRLLPLLDCNPTSVSHELDRGDKREYKVWANKRNNSAFFARAGQKFRFTVRANDEWRDDGHEYGVGGTDGWRDNLSTFCLEHSFENLMSLLCIIDADENDFINLGEKLELDEPSLNLLNQRFAQGQRIHQIFESGDLNYTYEWVASKNGRVVFRANECRNDFDDNDWKIHVKVERIDEECSN